MPVQGFDTEKYLTPARSMEASVKRRSTVRRLTSLGIHTELIGRACAVTPPTANRILKHHEPRKITALLGLDCLGLLLTHMERELGLPDLEIKRFIECEPTISDSERGMHDFWSDTLQRSYEVPLVSHIGSPYGQGKIEMRLTEQYPRRSEEHTVDLQTTAPEIFYDREAGYETADYWRSNTT